jgi:manganese transport protein
MGQHRKEVYGMGISSSKDVRYSAYKLPTDKVKEPPTTLIGRLKHIGPGIVVTASIVGSGELIATTSLGAQAGFITLWAIILSCALKIILQLEMAKVAISSGKPALAFLDTLPGPRLIAGWAVWAWLVMLLAKFIQFGGILNSTSQSVKLAIPRLGVDFGVVLIAIITALVLSYGRYKAIERISTVLVVCFVIFTVGMAILTMFTKYAFSLVDILRGLTFRLPPEAAFAAIGAFGITGIGGDEITQYTYWCIEKGYAANTGPNDGSGAWYARAKGWFKVMYLDATIAMIIYTAATLSFYILGASVLHGQGKVPEGMNMVSTLSNMYTGVLGGRWVIYFFALGAFACLFSTLISWTAGSQRIIADVMARLKLIDFESRAQVNKVIFFSGIGLPAMYTLTALVMRTPTLMVQIGGWGTAFILLVIIYGAFYHRFRILDPKLRPGKFYDFYLVIGSLAILGVVAYSVWQLLPK